MEKMTWREAMAGLAQGVINVSEQEAETIEKGSRIYRGMDEVCRMVNDAEKGEARCPICRERSAKLLEVVAHLFAKFRDSNMDSEDFAEFLLISMYRDGALSSSHEPDGSPTAQSWPGGASDGER